MLLSKVKLLLMAYIHPDNLFLPIGIVTDIIRATWRFAPLWTTKETHSMSEAPEDRRQLPELSIFHDVAKALTSSLNLDSVLQTIMETMAEYFRPDTWSLLIVEDTPAVLYFAIPVVCAPDSPT